MRHALTLVAVLALTSAAAAAIRTETIDYEHGGATLQAYVAWDDAIEGRRPGVLVVHEWWGQNDYARRRARELAAMGYVGLALDMYGTGVLATTPDEARALATPFYTDRALMRSRATAGLQQLASHRLVDGERLAAIGYCFGGTVALELARSGADLDAAVSFHGGLSNPTPADAGRIKADVLICHGADDPLVAPEEKAAFIAEMKEAGVPWTLIEYSGAVHSFTNPTASERGIPGVAYDERADKSSWDHLAAHLKRAFGAS